MKWLFPFIIGFVLAAGLLWSVTLFAQDGTLQLVRPLVVDIHQAVPVVADVVVPLDSGEVITKTLPLTLHVSLQISVADGTIALQAKPDTTVAKSIPTANVQTQNAQDTNKGIVFGEPTILGEGGLAIGVVLVTNTTDLVKTFTVKATYKTDDKIVGTSSGAVNNLLPGQTRAAMLVAMEEIPSDYETVRVDVDTLLAERESTSQAETASQIIFGEPVVGGFGVNVEATNKNERPHSFTVQATFMRDGELVGFATGAVNDLAPGQTKTATLIIYGETEDAEIQMAVESVLE